MSTTLYITAESSERRVDGMGNDRVFLARWMDRLDELAKTLGVTPLSKFMSYDPEFLAEFGVDDAPPAQYFDAADAATSAEALLKHLEQNPPTFAVLGKSDRSADLLHDLKNCRDVFTAAARQGIRIRCWIGD